MPVSTQATSHAKNIYESKTPFNSQQFYRAYPQ